MQTRLRSGHSKVIFSSTELDGEIYSWFSQPDIGSVANDCFCAANCGFLEGKPDHERDG